MRLTNSGNNLTLETDPYLAKLQKIDPDFSATLDQYPELPTNMVQWIASQPELEQFTRPLIENQSNSTSKSHKMQLRLMATAINTYLEK